MNILDIIAKRKSVRTFDGRPLSAEDTQKILDFADSVDNPYHIPIRWQLLDTNETGLSSPVIVGANAFLAGKVQRVPFAAEAFGYSFEQIVLFAASIGVGTTWIAGTMDRAAFERAVHLANGEVMPCVTPLGYPAKKMSLRESIMRKGVKADSRLPFSSLFFDTSFERPLSPEGAGRLRDVLQAVRLAPSAVNKQPWRTVVCGDLVHFYKKKNKPLAPVAWDIQKVDLGIALCHFALAAKEIGLSAAFQIEDPGLACGTDTAYIATYLIG